LIYIIHWFGLEVFFFLFFVFFNCISAIWVRLTWCQVSGRGAKKGKDVCEMFDLYRHTFFYMVLSTT
jgi:hypothetical protein